MINISIERNGEITISQETAEERISLSRHYESYNAFEEAFGAKQGEEKSEDPRTEETKKDEERAAFFKQGWEMAIREAQLNFVNGRIIEFFQEMGGYIGDRESTDPHRAEPDGTGEEGFAPVSIDDFPNGHPELDDVAAAGWADTPISNAIRGYIERENEARHAANEIGLTVGLAAIRPVGDSGEPELEKNQTWDLHNEGVWTMTNDELKSRLEDAYNRGWEQNASAQREAGYQEGFSKGQTVAKQTTQRSLDIIAVEINGQVLQWWDEKMSSDDTIKEVISKGEYAREFARNLATRLGYEVSA